jgi:hypothetical protein
LRRLRSIRLAHSSQVSDPIVRSIQRNSQQLNMPEQLVLPLDYLDVRLKSALPKRLCVFHKLT